MEKLDYESLGAAKPQTTMKNTWGVKLPVSFLYT